MKIKNIQATRLGARRLFPDRSATVDTRHSKKREKSREKNREDEKDNEQSIFISEKLVKLSIDIIHETKEFEC